MAIRIFIAAHTRLCGQALAAALAEQEGIDVVGVTSGRGTASECLVSHNPDILLFDSALSSMSPGLADAAGRPRVLALASLGTEPEPIPPVKAAVHRYVTYDESLADLLAAIRGLGPSPRPTDASVPGSDVDAEAPLDSTARPLTRRELEVVRLLDEGLSNKQIARRLGIRLPTVKNHVHHILEKLAAARRGEAAARMRQGSTERRVGSVGGLTD
jgi:two-component system nitrate/nitrite response regulator NarL